MQFDASGSPGPCGWECWRYNGGLAAVAAVAAGTGSNFGDPAVQDAMKAYMDKPEVKAKMAEFQSQREKEDAQLMAAVHRTLGKAQDTAITGSCWVPRSTCPRSGEAGQVEDSAGTGPAIRRMPPRTLGDQSRERASTRTNRLPSRPQQSAPVPRRLPPPHRPRPGGRVWPRSAGLTTENLLNAVAGWAFPHRLPRCCCDSPSASQRPIDQGRESDAGSPCAPCRRASSRLVFPGGRVPRIRTQAVVTPQRTGAKVNGARRRGLDHASWIDNGSGGPRAGPGPRRRGP